MSFINVKIAVAEISGNLVTSFSLNVTIEYIFHRGEWFRRKQRYIFCPLATREKIASEL